MSVGGDTLTGVAQLAQGLQTGAAGGRPLSLDLLWQVRAAWGSRFAGGCGLAILWRSCVARVAC